MNQESTLKMKRIRCMEWTFALPSLFNYTSKQNSATNCCCTNENWSILLHMRPQYSLFDQNENCWQWKTLIWPLQSNCQYSQPLSRIGNIKIITNINYKQQTQYFFTKHTIHLGNNGNVSMICLGNVSMICLPLPPIQRSTFPWECVQL